MRVLIFRTNGNLVNLNTYNLQEIGIAKALLLCGIDCDVLYFGGNRTTHEELIDFQGQKVRIIWAKGYSIAGNGLFPGIQRILDRYDIIQVCEYDQLFSRYIAFFSKYKNHVCMTHGPYYNESNKRYNKKIEVIDKLWIPKKQKERIWCFAKSEYAKEFLEKRGFKRVVVTGVGLDIERFRQRNEIEPNEIVKSVIEFKGSNHLLLYIGQISDRRNTLFLIDVMKRITELTSNVKMAIIGNGPDEYKKECLNRIEEYGLQKRIYYAEKIIQEQVPLLYKNADAFLLPTKYEIFGMVMLEAMFFGTPFFTTENGGSITVIKHGENGFILPLEVDKWVNTIIDLLDNKEKAKAVADNAHITIEEKFTWQNVVSSMVDIYETMISEKQG